jgi:hypothetical protein
MSAINQLTQVTQKIAEATAMIAQLQALIPALALAAGAETAAPAPKVKKVKKAKAAAAEAPAPAAVEAAPAAVEAAPAAVEAKPKKPASEGTMAWHAFVKHVQEVQPSRFADLKKHSERLHEAKAIHEEDEEGYKSFVAAWKATRLALESPEAPAEEIIVVAGAVAADVKEKRKVAAGTMAWHAYVTHCKATMPELAALSKSSEKLQAIKARKQNDKTGYDSFVAEWKAAQPVA